MNTTLKIILYSSAAGLPIIVGGTISSFFQAGKLAIKDEVNRWIVAFAGGALLSAISFALIPQAVSDLRSGPITLIFLSGTLSFMVMDILIVRIGGSFAQVLSMMMDFLPEALALGASFAHNHNLGLLLAVFIGLQNLPEGFASYPELNRMMSKKSTLWLMFGLSFVGIIAALSGEMLLSDKPGIIAGIMLFAAGGILYLIFQDIAPESKKKNDWIPATGASVGFLIGIIGEKLL